MLGAAASAVLLSLGLFERPLPPPGPVVVPPAGAIRRSGGLAAVCGPRTVPEGDVCVPLPPPGALVLGEADAAAAPPAQGGARSAEAGERIPRRPDRPAPAAAYAYPIGAPDRAPAFLDAEAASAAPSAEPPSWVGGVDIAAERGERVTLAPLEAQQGKAEVAFVGELSGITVATAHTVQDGDRERRYLVVYGHLDRPGPGVVPGARLSPGDVVGFVGDSGSPGVVQLHLEIRRVRDGARLDKLDPKRLTDAALSVPCDLRNVLMRR